MKNFVSQVRFRILFPLLLLAVLFTLPSASTGSKYVWNDTINIELKVSNHRSEITRMLPEGEPSEFWVRNLTNIQAVSTADGVVLTADQGYTLPEYITVKVGEKTFSVKTDGTEAPEGFSFDPATGLLSVSEMYLTGKSVVLQAEGVEVTKDDVPEKTEPEKTEPEQETEPTVSGEAEQTSDAVPLDQPDE